MTKYNPVPLEFERLDRSEMQSRADALLEQMGQRRSVRSFSTDPVDRALIDRAIEIASTAPSGAHRQPWHFVVVDDVVIKEKIREAAELEEERSYRSRMPKEWLDALVPIGTDASKPALVEAPYLVVLFAETHGLDDSGQKVKNYYVTESVGIAAGIFVAAVHQMGLATLTHTPSPMGFLRKILQRPTNERPFLLFPVGIPASDCQVPDLQRKTLDQVSSSNLEGRSGDS